MIYKITSKVMANHLKVILPGLISSHESAFVPGWLITDNALVAFEIFHGMKHRGNGKKGVMALELDMSKAYDRVKWSFLRHVMLKLGFCENWIEKVMMSCSSVTYSCKLNDKLIGHIIPERGLRQENLISPSYFSCLQKLLVRAADRGEIHGAKVCRDLSRVSRLFFCR